MTKKGKNTKNRILQRQRLSLLLILSMIFTMLPVSSLSVRAAEDMHEKEAGKGIIKAESENMTGKELSEDETDRDILPEDEDPSKDEEAAKALSSDGLLSQNALSGDDAKELSLSENDLISGENAKDASWSGSGSESDPYHIADLNGLKKLAEAVNSGDDQAGKYFKLTADIDCGSDSWTPIGNGGKKFSGIFDGGGKSISYRISNAKSDIQGLFGLVETKGDVTAAVKHLRVSGSIDGESNIYGGVAGQINSAEIEDCYSAVFIKSSSKGLGSSYGECCLGGIVGVNYLGKVTYCLNSGRIRFSRMGTPGGGGGIVGAAYGGEIKNCIGVGAVENLDNKNYTAMILGAVVGGGVSIYKCYYDAAYSSIGGIGGSGKSETDMSGKTEAKDKGTLMQIVSSAPDACMVFKNSLANVLYNGLGTEDDPFVIADTETFRYFMEDVNRNNKSYEGYYFSLKNEIDLSSYEFTPIGSSISSSFNGVFNGNGYSIKYAKDRGSGEYHGLFGVLGSKGVIEGLEVEAFYDRYYKFVGGIVGYNLGTVRNCYCNFLSDSSALLGCNYVGGLAAVNAGTIDHCSVRGWIYFGSNIGGITASNEGIVSNCIFAKGKITGINASSRMLLGFHFGPIYAAARGTVIDNFYDVSQFEYAGTTGMRSDTEGIKGVKTVTIQNTARIAYLQGYRVFAKGVTEDISAPWSGSGSSGDPYLLKDNSDFDSLSEYISYTDYKGVYFRLENDISYTEAGTTIIIGDSTHPFNGTLLGNEKTIEYRIISASEKPQGLFGCLGPDALVRDLNLKGDIVSQKSSAGTVTADNKGTIINCYSSVNINTPYTGGNFGGIAALNSGTIDHCSYSGDIRSTASIGGIAGINSGTIKSAVFTGRIIYSALNVNNCGMITASRSDSSGTVTGSYYLSQNAGDFKGFNDKDVSGQAEGKENNDLISFAGSVKEDYPVFAQGILDTVTEDRYQVISYNQISVSYGGTLSEKSLGVVVREPNSLPKPTLTYESLSSLITVANGKVSSVGNIVSSDKISVLYVRVTAEENTYEGIHYMTTSVNIPIAVHQRQIVSDNGFTFSVIPEQVYTGKSIEPEINITDNLTGEQLTADKEYTVDYRNNVRSCPEDGENPPCVIIKGIGNYSGSVEIPFGIYRKLSSLEDFQAIGSDSSDYFVMKNDIDLTASGNWTPIEDFAGILSGNGYSVSYNSQNAYEEKLGLFATVSSDGIIKDLVVKGRIDSQRLYKGVEGERAGGIAVCNRGTISDCFSYVDITSGSQGAVLGGIAGKNEGIIDHCGAGGLISSLTEAYTGGIAGENSGRMKNAVFTGVIYCESESTGMLAGRDSSGTYTDCYYVTEHDTGYNAVAGNSMSGCASKAHSEVYTLGTSAGSEYNVYGEGIRASLLQSGTAGMSFSGQPYSFYYGSVCSITAQNAGSYQVDSKYTDVISSIDNAGKLNTSGIGVARVYAVKDSGRIPAAVMIKKKSISSSDITVADIPDQNFEKDVPEPEVTVSDTTLNKVLVENVDYVLTYKNNREIAFKDDTDPPTVIITGIGNYEGTTDSTFNIVTDAIQIKTVDELKAVAAAPDENYIIVKDIVIEDENWTPIGSESKPFTGSLLGAGKTVTLNIKAGAKNNIGLFGYIGQGGVVRGLNVSGNISGSGYTYGGIAGNNKGTIVDCYSAVDVSTDTGGNIGGIAGMNGSGATVSCCAASGKIKSTDLNGRNVGGIAGSNLGCVEYCTFTGTVGKLGSYIGMTVGYNTATVSSCNHLAIRAYGSSSVGGGSGTVTDCTAKIANELSVIAAEAYSEGYKVYAAGIRKSALPQKSEQSILGFATAGVYALINGGIFAMVTDPSDVVTGELTYEVKEGYEDCISLNNTSGNYIKYEALKAGEAYVTVTAAETDDCYVAFQDIKIVTEPKPIYTLDMYISGINDQPYTGKAIEPEPVLYDKRRQEKLVKNVDYYLTYANNKDVASENDTKPPTITISGMGNYAESYNEYFGIRKIDDSDVDVEMSFDSSYYYSQDPKSLTDHLKIKVSGAYNAEYKYGSSYGNDLDAIYNADWYFVKELKNGEVELADKNTDPSVITDVKAGDKFYVGARIYIKNDHVYSISEPFEITVQKAPVSVNAAYNFFSAGSGDREENALVNEYLVYKKARNDLTKDLPEDLVSSEPVIADVSSVRLDRASSGRPFDYEIYGVSLTDDNYTVDPSSSKNEEGYGYYVMPTLTAYFRGLTSNKLLDVKTASCNASHDIEKFRSDYRNRIPELSEEDLTVRIRLPYETSEESDTRELSGWFRQDDDDVSKLSATYCGSIEELETDTVFFAAYDTIDTKEGLSSDGALRISDIEPVVYTGYPHYTSLDISDYFGDQSGSALRKYYAAHYKSTVKEANSDIGLKIYDYSKKYRLVEGRDYTVAYKNNVNVYSGDGYSRKTPALVITYKGDYKGREKSTLYYRILPLDIRNVYKAALTKTAVKTGTKAGELRADANKDILSEYACRYKKNKLKYKTDYDLKVTFKNDVLDTKDRLSSEGRAYVSVYGKGNYGGSLDALPVYVYDTGSRINASKTKITLKDLPSSGKYTYSVSGVEPAVEVSYRGSVIDPSQYSIDYGNNKSAGRQTLTVTFNIDKGTGYYGSKKKTYRIEGMKFTAAVSEGTAFSGEEKRSELFDLIKVTGSDGSLLTRGSDYVITWSGLPEGRWIMPGKYKFAVVGCGRYSGCKKTVKPAIQKAVLSLNNIIYQGKSFDELKDINVSYTKSGVRPYISISSGNYYQDSDEKNYNGNLLKYCLVNISYSGKRKAGSSGMIKIRANGKYADLRGGSRKNTVEKVFNVNAASLGSVSFNHVADVKLSGDQKKLVNNRLVQVYDSEGNELKYNTDYTFDMPVKDGEYMKITVKGKGNYEGSISASAKTCKGSVRNARLTVAESQKKLVYNGSVQKAGVKVEVPVVSGNSVVYVTLTEGKDYTLLYYKKGAGLINPDADVIYPGTVYVRAAGLAGGACGDESLVSKKTASYRITAK